MMKSGLSELREKMNIVTKIQEKCTLISSIDVLIFQFAFDICLS